MILRTRIGINTDMINLTENAKTRIIEILKEESDPTTSLRTFVQGGGCSGFQYGFTLDNEQSEDDFVIDVGQFKVLVDAMSMQYLENSTIDFKEDLVGSMFSISNPGATSTLSLIHI